MATSSPGPVQPGQPATVARVGLDPITGRGGDQRRRDHLATDPHAVKQPGELVAGRPGFVAGSQPPGIAQAANEPANRRLVMGDPLHHGHLTAGREDPNRDGVPVDVKAEVGRGEMRNTGHGRLLRMLAPSAKDG
jgi:hypothetical protein